MKAMILDLIAGCLSLAAVACLVKLARVDQQGGLTVNEPEIVTERLEYFPTNYGATFAALDWHNRQRTVWGRVFLKCDSNNVEREIKAYRAVMLGEKVDLSCNVKQ